VEDVSIDLDLLRHRPGFSPAVIENTDGRINVVGVHHPSGSATGRSLILNGHMDVVPTGPQDLWSRSPFDPHVEGDWIYGRGSGDMKAGIVAYCIAFQALQQLGLQPAGQVRTGLPGSGISRRRRHYSRAHGAVHHVRTVGRDVAAG
jgi:acetylornithine deacetylase